MKQKLLLNTFEYSIVPSAVVMPETDMKCYYSVTQHLPLLNVRIDFEKGAFTAEGDWHYMVAATKYSGTHWYSFHKGRVKVKASLNQALMINLDDRKSDGMVFPFKGTIEDGNAASSCSGLVVIDNRNEGSQLISDQWSIILYLYDYQFDSCEIIFKLPVYVRGMNAELN